MYKLSILLLTGFLFGFTGYSQTFTDKEIEKIQKGIDSNVKGALSIHIDQDWFMDWWPEKNFDRNYTQGTAFEISRPDLNHSILLFPLVILENLASKQRKDPKYIRFPSSIALGVTAFTPLNIDEPDPVAGDRPFASVLFLTTKTSRLNLNTKFIVSNSISYGIFGTNIAYAFQSWAHKDLIKGRPVDISWEHQISRGGSFGFYFQHSGYNSFLSFKNRNQRKTWLSAVFGYQLDIGWYTGGATSLTLKAGQIDDRNMLAAETRGALSSVNKRNELFIESFTKDHRPPEKRWIFDFYAFGKFSPRLTAYNSFVLGQKHTESIYTLNYEDYNPFAVDLEYGIVLSFMHMSESSIIPLRRWDLVLSLNHRSPEIRVENEYQRWHHWGRISITTPFL